MIGLGSDKNINSGWPQIRSLAPFILNVFTQNHHVFIIEAINTKTTQFGIGHRQNWMDGQNKWQYSHTFSGNVAGHSIHKSILFWLVKIHREVRVNLIIQFCWDPFCSEDSAADGPFPRSPCDVSKWCQGSVEIVSKLCQSFVKEVSKLCQSHAKVV